MAILTIKCPECGGDKAVEVSPHKYNCQYCGATFTTASEEPVATPQKVVCCPYCGGELEFGVLKCRHCGEWLRLQDDDDDDDDDEEEEEEEEQAKEAESKSNSGCLWFQLVAVGGAVWGATGKWWTGLVTFIVLAICTQIPLIGFLLCILLGAGVGLLAGVISAVLSAPTWACWLIGGFVALSVIALNLNDKDSDD